MSETTFTLNEARAEYEEMDLDALHQEYETDFGAPAFADGTEILTTDGSLLVRKLAYARLLKQYDEASEEVPARVSTLAQKAFDAPFVKTGAKRSRDNTIQAFIVKRLWSLTQDGFNGQHTVAELAEEVCANFPESTFKNAPVARMKTDINKYNKGLFPYGVANNMVPDGTNVPFYKAKAIDPPKIEEESADEE